ncbi:pre-rRNA processing protein [Ascosphaera acerosa]|nr:pre-rRNA processing protein [Ascosphaera acerosa]
MTAHKLKAETPAQDEFKGRVFRQIADKLAFAAPTTHSFFRADTQATTSVAIHPPYVYTVSKDKTLIKWELAAPAATTATSEKRRPPRRKPRKLAYVRGLQRTDADDGAQHGHTGAILTVAASPSGAFVATGGADRRIIVWDAATLAPLRTFSQHRDAISGLSFSRAGPDYALGSNNISSGEQLFSASFDRTIKTWSLAPGAHAYVETLFGHQDHVLDVAAMAADQCVSVGARDRTARLWKVVDETQLIFRGGSSTNKRGRTGAAANESDTPAEAEGSIERIAALPPAHFVTGSDNGALALWSIHKKKPLCTVPLAHGRDPLPPAGDLSAERDPAVAQRVTARLRPSPRWITALAALPGTDVVLSGSWDGWVRAWRVSEDKRRLVPLGVVGGDEATGEGRIRGVVNDIAVFERRDRSAAAAAFANAGPAGDEGEEQARQPAGLCVVAAVGKECRLGRWKTLGSKRVEGEPAGRNGAVVIEVPFKDGVDVEKEGEADTAES